MFSQLSRLIVQLATRGAGPPQQQLHRGAEEPGQAVGTFTATHPPPALPAPASWLGKGQGTDVGQMFAWLGSFCR